MSKAITQFLDARDRLDEAKRNLDDAERALIKAYPTPGTMLAAAQQMPLHSRMKARGLAFDMALDLDLVRGVALGTPFIVTLYDGPQAQRWGKDDRHLREVASAFEGASDPVSFVYGTLTRGSYAPEDYDIDTVVIDLRDMIATPPGPVTITDCTRIGP